MYILPPGKTHVVAKEAKRLAEKLEREEEEAAQRRAAPPPKQESSSDDSMDRVDSVSQSLDSDEDDFF